MLDGGAGDDVLAGGTSPGIGLAGSREVDLLHGGTGADTFVLGSATGGRFYDDRSSLTPGYEGYARIDDFRPSDGDRLLKGGAVEYFMGASPIAGVAGTALFHDTDGDGVLDAAHDELLAIFESPEALTHTNTIDVAFFV